MSKNTHTSGVAGEKMPPLRIRRVRLADAADVARLSIELGYPYTAAGMRRALGKLRGDRTQAVIVGTVNGRVVAWLQVARSNHLVSSNEAEVTSLVVGSDIRSRGIGAKLMRWAETWARAHGCGAMKVRSNVIRRRAHRFYVRLGYPVVKKQAVFKKRLG